MLEDGGFFRPDWERPDSGQDETRAIALTPYDRLLRRSGFQGQLYLPGI